jgi:hypothetical protein
MVIIKIRSIAKKIMLGSPANEAISRKINNSITLDNFQKHRNNFAKAPGKHLVAG